MSAPEVTLDALLASVRSVITAVPAPRPPADERDDGVWLSAGRYQIRLDDQQEEK
jgi:hypothetical protein